MGIYDIWTQLKTILSKYWWAILLLIGIVFIITLISKRKKRKIEWLDYLNEVKARGEKELEFNPTEVKFIRRLNKNYRVYGEIILGVFKPDFKENRQRVDRAFRAVEIRKSELEQIKDQMIGEQELPEFYVHIFLVRRTCLDLLLFKIYLGEKDQVFLTDVDFIYTKDNTIRLDDTKRFVWQEGFYRTPDARLIDIVTDRVERLSSELRINASGMQMKDFSRIRSDYAHEIDMKDKDIESEKEVQRNRSFGGRT